eukprot:656799-Prymnesium_polylepis.1
MPSCDATKRRGGARRACHGTHATPPRRPHLAPPQTPSYRRPPPSPQTAHLDARASGVVEADDGRADLECLIHDFADLFGVRLAQRAAEHREVLREDEDAPPVDLAVARHDTVSRRLIVLHTEVDAAVGLEHVVLAECPWVKQQLQPLARRQLSLAVLRFNPTGSASEERRLLVLLERGGYRLGLLDEDGRRRGAQDSHAQVRTQQRRRPATPADDGTQHI